MSQERSPACALRSPRNRRRLEGRVDQDSAAFEPMDDVLVGGDLTEGLFVVISAGRGFRASSRRICKAARFPQAPSGCAGHGRGRSGVQDSGRPLPPWKADRPAIALNSSDQLAAVADSTRCAPCSAICWSIHIGSQWWPSGSPSCGRASCRPFPAWGRDQRCRRELAAASTSLSTSAGLSQEIASRTWLLL